MRFAKNIILLNQMKSTISLRRRFSVQFADIHKTTIQRFLHGAPVYTGLRKMKVERADYGNMPTRQPDTLRLAGNAGSRCLPGRWR